MSDDTFDAEKTHAEIHPTVARKLGHLSERCIRQFIRSRYGIKLRARAGQKQKLLAEVSRILTKKEPP